MLLNDRDIRRLCTPVIPDSAFEQDHKPPMIEPFSESVSGGGIISYGLDHAGYCIRLGPEVLFFKNTSSIPLDPKLFSSPTYKEKMYDRFFIEDDKIIKEDVWNRVIIPAHSYILGSSLEYLRIPRWLKGRCVGKSTYARCGIVINTTPLEPEWEGTLTIEIGNVSPCPAAVYVGEGIAQLEFEMLTGAPEVSYKDKGGKYQKQTSTTPAIVK